MVATLQHLLDFKDKQHSLVCLFICQGREDVGRTLGNVWEFRTGVWVLLSSPREGLDGMATPPPDKISLDQ